MTETDKALKPCPFCGSEATLFTARISEDWMWAKVTCNQCAIETHEFEDAYAPVAEAIAAWNTRPSDARIHADDAGLVAGLEHIWHFPEPRTEAEARGHSKIAKQAAARLAVLSPLEAEVERLQLALADLAKATADVPAAEAEAATLRARVAELEDVTSELLFWVKGALNTKSWVWDADRRFAAESLVKRISAAAQPKEAGDA